MASERVLIHTFRKILYDAANETRDYKFPEDLRTLYEKYTQSCCELEKSKTEIHKFDAVLCDYLLQFSCEESLSYSQKLKEIAQREDSLSFVEENWGKKAWMEELFYFLDDDSSFRQRVIPAGKVRILSDLFAFVRANVRLSCGSALKRMPVRKCEADPPSMLHDVMLVFFDYFCQQNRPAILELILPYFVVFGDEYNNEQMEVLSWRSCESDEKAYVSKNLEFQVGKRLTLLSYENRIESSDNIENVKRVFEKLKKNDSLNTDFV